MLNTVITLDSYINSLMPLLHGSLSNCLFIITTSLFDAQTFILWFLLLLAYLVYRHLYFAAAFLFFGVAGGQTVKIVLKHLTGRERPENPFGLPVHESSFPSGHATTSVFFFLALWYLLTPHMASLSKVWRTLLQGALLLGMVLVPFSRLFVQVHYLSDVLFGVLLGVMSFVVTWLVFTQYKKYKQNNI